MNKTDFLKALEEELNIDHNTSVKINSILEDTFFMGNKGKEELISKFQKELDYSLDEAENTYEVCMKIMSMGIIDKLKHPFKGND